MLSKILCNSVHTRGHFFDHLSLKLVGLMLVIPFIMPLDFVFNEAIAFLLGFLALVFKKNLSENRELPRISFFVLGLICLLLLQLLIGIPFSSSLTIVAIIYLSWATMLIMLGKTLREQVGLQQMTLTLAWFIAVGGILSALAAVLQHYKIHAFFDVVVVLPKAHGPLYGNLRQPNLFASYINMGLISIFYLYAIGKLPRLFTIVTALLFLLVLDLAASRTAALLLMSIVFSIFLFYFLNKNLQSKKLLIAALLLIPGLIVIHLLITYLVIPQQTSSLTVSVEEKFISPEGVVTIQDKMTLQSGAESQRLNLLRAGWRMFLSAPFTGIGYGQFSKNYYLMPDAYPYNKHWVYHHSHNLFMHLLAEMGILAPVLVLVFGVLWLVSFFRQTFTAAHWWIVSLLIILGVDSMLEYPLWYSYFLGIAAILLGMGESRSVNLLKLVKLKFAHPRIESK